MKHIDEKFKEASPDSTVERIKGLLAECGIETVEEWNESGVDNCFSLVVSAKGGFPSSNGKGVTKEFARASAYGEFIERLQCGLFLYKYQSLENDMRVNLQHYAPDKKYFTVEELAERSDWFDYIIETYGNGLTRKKIAEQCKMYDSSDDGNILCVPFYSLFEDKYVYVPEGFAEHIYSANGCCAGNTREEALVHAFSEIMERKATISVLTNGNSLPRMPEEVLKKYPTVSRILEQIRENEHLDVTVFDCSIGNGFPVMSTRVIDKDKQSYAVNVAADPVLEIALQRTLTEMFQGRNIRNLTGTKEGLVLGDTNELRTASNVINQLENGSGVFTADYFADELTCEKKATDFEDNSGLTNSQLLKKIIALYKEIGNPVFIRNCGFLGFPCYKVIVPGYSESRGFRLTESIQEYGLADFTSKVLRNPTAYDVFDFEMVQGFRKLIDNVFSRRTHFSRLSGVPIESSTQNFLWHVTVAYMAWKRKDKKELLSALGLLAKSEYGEENDRKYFACVRQYFELRFKGIEKDKVFSVLEKFNRKQCVDELRENLNNGSAFDKYLLKCDFNNCACCRYKDKCKFESLKNLMEGAGEVYSKFTDGQSRENFIFN